MRKDATSAQDGIVLVDDAAHALHDESVSMQLHAFIPGAISIAGMLLPWHMLHRGPNKKRCMHFL